MSIGIKLLSERCAGNRHARLEKSVQMQSVWSKKAAQAHKCSTEHKPIELSRFSRRENSYYPTNA